MKLKQQPEDFIVKENNTIMPEKEGEYTYFVLKKRSITTLGAMQQISATLRVPLKWVGCAGNKDKTAITEQVCSVATIPPERLQTLRFKDFSITPTGKGNKPVSLGDLKNNEFVITIRDIDKLPENKTRFVNLFGEQRFSTNNAEIGKAIIKRNFEQAVTLLLITKTQVAQKINQILAQTPKNYVGALKSLPTKLLKLYVHAYQSLLWNQMAVEHSKNNDENTKLPIIGFGTSPDNQTTEILKREEITTRDFIIKELPELSSEGTERDVFAEASNLSIGKLEADELNAGRKKVIVSFSLPPGSYATEYVRQLFA
jgi:tRNA pseudouridine13 synthase